MHQFPPKDQILWSLTAPPPPQIDGLDGDLTCDVLIVGAGLTGLRAALALGEAGVDVAVIDAKAIGHGASGRSGGQCNPIWRSTPDDLREKFGSAQAERLIQTTLTCADDLFDDIRRFDIKCAAEQNGWVQAAHTRKASSKLERLAAAWQTEGASIETLAGSDLQKRLGSPAYEHALFHEKGGFVQPLALTRGFAQAAQAHGVRLIEKTRAKRMTRKNGKWQVSVSGGTIRAENVILTTNAYSDNLWPGLRQTLLPMFSIIMATRPLTDEERATVLPGRVTMADTRAAIYYCRYDADNRLVFGCVGSAEKSGVMMGRRRLSRALQQVFPQLGAVEIECSWGGRIGVTPDMIPNMHAPAPGVLAGLGFSGRGIAMTSVMGKALARKVLGGQNTDLPFPVEGMKTIPLHGLARSAVPLMAPALATKDQLEVILDKRGSERR